jgi:hypothetical protein
MLNSQVGIEIEYLLRNKKNELVIPPTYHDTDDFPLLGEIRAEPGKDKITVLTNYSAALLRTQDSLRKADTLCFEDVAKCSLELYRAASKLVDPAEKSGGAAQVKNIYGTKLVDFSDKIITDGKIQGLNVSCGLHIHFSCEELKELKVEEAQYEHVTLPLDWNMVGTMILSSDKGLGLQTLASPAISLYKFLNYKEKKTLTVRSSKLNKPTIEWIVKALDEEFFERFAPAKSKRTKYRQPGFYELKPYGFEYRSLPANQKVLDAMPEIVEFSLKLLAYCI